MTKFIKFTSTQEWCGKTKSFNVSFTESMTVKEFIQILQNGDYSCSGEISCQILGLTFSILSYRRNTKNIIWHKRIYRAIKNCELAKITSVGGLDCMNYTISIKQYGAFFTELRKTFKKKKTKRNYIIISKHGDQYNNKKVYFPDNITVNTFIEKLLEQSIDNFFIETKSLLRTDKTLARCHCGKIDYLAPNFPVIANLTISSVKVNTYEIDTFTIKVNKGWRFWL